PIELKRLSPGREARVDQLSGMMHLSVQLTPTSDTRRIGSFKARKYQLEITSGKGVKVGDTALWVGKDPQGERAYSRLAGRLTARQPGAADLARQMEQLDGFPVLQETTLSMMGKPVKAREELVAIENREPPADIYEPPGGYAAKPYDVTL